MEPIACLTTDLVVKNAILRTPTPNSSPGGGVEAVRRVRFRTRGSHGRDPNPEPLQPTPNTRSPKPEARSPKPEPRNPKSETRSPKHEARNPKPEARSPSTGEKWLGTEIPNPKPETRTPKPSPGEKWLEIRERIYVMDDFMSSWASSLKGREVRPLRRCALAYL